MKRYDQRGQKVNGDQYNVVGSITLPASPSAQEKKQKRDYQSLLKRVKARVTEEIKSSLYNEVLHELGLLELSEEVMHPWHFVFHPSPLDAYELPSGTTITDVYDRTQGTLLLLGEGGAGKTTLLLQLALDLLDRAEKDDANPIPVMLNLSSWASKKLPLDQWFGEELSRKPYRLSPDITQRLIRDDLFLPLLDGFNQMEATERSACVHALKDYQKNHSLISLVICSRDDKILKQKKDDFIDATCFIQPLTSQQIDAYISSIDGKKTWLKDVFSKDHLLYKLAKTPLMLCILTLAFYHGSTPIPWTRATLDVQRHQLFALYVERMLKRKDISRAYLPHDMEQWLTQLARYMIKTNETTFYIEYMQRLDFITEGLFYGVESSLFTSIWAAGYLAIIGPIWDVYHLNSYFPNLLEISAHIPSFVLYLFFLLIFLWARELGQIRYSAYIIPTKTIWFWQVRKYKFWQTEQPKNKYRWALLLYLYLISMELVFRSTGLPSTVPELATAFLLITIPLLDQIRIPVALIHLEKNVLLEPNQGIWVSTRQGIWYGLGSGFISGLLVGLAFWQTQGPSLGIYLGFGVGLVVLWLVGIRYGGRACIQHFQLRLFLSRSRVFPLNLSRFLRAAEQCLLLRRVAGGYSFIHPLLQEYFVALGTTSPIGKEVISDHKSTQTFPKRSQKMSPSISGGPKRRKRPSRSLHRRSNA